MQPPAALIKRGILALPCLATAGSPHFGLAVDSQASPEPPPAAD